MPWIQLRINTNSDDAETISDLLMEEGAVSITFEDGKDTPIFEPKLGETPLWRDTVVVALFEADTDLTPSIEMLKTLPFLGEHFSHKIEQIEDKDWVREWMDNYHPIQFGKRLWICPSWREVPDPTAVNVILDPGLAFGTGTHPTTALCLEWLDSLDLSNEEVIDFGCGSGILAVAALKLGAKKVTGIDIDYQAIEASKANAERNDVADQLELYLPEDQPADLKADVLVANILAGPLRELAPLIAERVKTGGKLALSGLLKEQAQEISDFYSQWFDMDEAAHKEDWSRLTGTRK
ncbi:50S ribosomal protein L11 methyltransferase [Shewanella xiamenensis]|uniref:50S ribosomal protein L11 methyltransferase n=1 Tax=Shewanella xiamenensis TaxID=332186 RepID=UPI0024A61773|nr:50S ribosomal protein L11 methyltransferase [Shewanella xiamenensis]MDI5834804.1 50S ribosomal protein L11 methyltransferase [Shewanella xiamenensis]MDI5838744.1 50S ribosomal protein L11 methyltransferase [Shewanella xiamenensis]MDI5842953.1 50S ribosomal protein L11 methyltransferase [Shewanella xiamenensis]MDI5850922.1 50S ribosomal protein L11 methyltransferase [Shewanella xiamenensis]MDI5854916.1 50S ribosomal protein L11 methyltransferase [Shewanella xiamenensis]